MYRGIPAPCSRSSDTDRGFDRCTRRPSAGGQDPPYRRIVSNVSERELARARTVASIVSVQNHYNLRDRSSDRLIDLCAEAGMAFIPWYPLAAGRLASPSSLLGRIAQSHGATPSQISLAWRLQRSPAMLPIPGTSSIAHLEENLASASIRLSADEFRTLASL